MKKIAALLLVLSTSVLAQENTNSTAVQSNEQFGFFSLNNPISTSLRINNCMIASVSNNGMVEINYKCAEIYAKEWKSNSYNDTSLFISVILNAIHNGTAKIKE